MDWKTRGTGTRSSAAAYFSPLHGQQSKPDFVGCSAAAIDGDIGQVALSDYKGK